MKVFRELTVFGEHEALEALVDRLESLLSEGWSRDWEHEAKLGRPFAQSYFRFLRRATTDRSAVALVMCTNSGRLRVVNIVVRDRELSCG